MGTRYGAGNHALVGRRGKWFLLPEDFSKVNLDSNSCWLLVDFALFASLLSIFGQHEGWQEVMIAGSDESGSSPCNSSVYGDII